MGRRMVRKVPGITTCEDANLRVESKEPFPVPWGGFDWPPVAHVADPFMAALSEAAAFHVARFLKALFAWSSMSRSRAAVSSGSSSPCILARQHVRQNAPDNDKPGHVEVIQVAPDLVEPHHLPKRLSVFLQILLNDKSPLNDRPLPASISSRCCFNSSIHSRGFIQHPTVFTNSACESAS